MSVIQRHGRIAGIETSWLEAPGPANVLYVHGVPNNAEMWRPFLERTGGVAVDLPGFGRTGKPAYFPYGIEGYARWLGDFADQAGLGEHSLCVHDWGAVGLAHGAIRPASITKVALLNCVPFLPGYRWHATARVWRTPVVGELLMGMSTRPGAKLLSRKGTVAPGPMPDKFIDAAWEHFDHGTQRAILKLYRASPPDVLERAGGALEHLSAPALVAWGAADIFIPSSFGQAYADALAGEARVELIEGAGHWPWIDKPEVIALVADFLTD
ncbi:MAG: alpha/beta hydrolase [Thermoleophilaceae bacterium]|nr:alpha/beta hydrolase [Thermoleophilaceae bacterium]